MNNIDRRRKRSTLQSQINLPPRVSESEEIRTDSIEEAVAATDIENGDVFSSSSNSPVKDDVTDLDYIQPVAKKHKSRTKFIDADMVAAMDKCKISSPCAVRVRLIIPTMKVLLKLYYCLTNNKHRISKLEYQVLFAKATLLHGRALS